jgi:hypothetical protein
MSRNRIIREYVPPLLRKGFFPATSQDEIVDIFDNVTALIAGIILLHEVFVGDPPPETIRRDCLVECDGAKWWG